MTPAHFYQQVPDTREFTSDLYEVESPLLGSDMRDEEQLLLLKKFTIKYQDEYNKFRYGGSDARKQHKGHKSFWIQKAA